MSRLYLVRHGETGWNVERRLQGQSDQPLNPRGETQARDAARLLANISFDHIICSDLARARTTADLMGYPDAQDDRAWREIDVGEWCGRLVDDLRKSNPEQWRAWRAGMIVPPGGEDWTMFRARLRGGLEALPGGSGRTLIVTHGGVIRTVVSMLIGATTDSLAPVPAGSLTLIELGGWPRLRRYGLTLGGDIADAAD